MIGVVEGIGNECYGCKGRDGYVKRVIAKRKPVLECLIFYDRLIFRAEDFRQETHARLRKDNSYETQPKGPCAKRFAEIIGNARAERVRQRGEEEMERMGKFQKVGNHLLVVSNW